MKTKQESFNEKDTKRKMQNLRLHGIANELSSEKRIKFSDKMLERVSNCGTYLEFLTDKKLEKRKLNFGIFCNNRFCPICAKRKSLNDTLAIKIMSEYVRQELKRRYILLTLTAPNVTGEELKTEINKYNVAFKKMFERKKYKNVVKGYLRKLEVTYNKKSNTYHPHFHVLISVSSRYFVEKGEYIKRDEWLKDWQEVMQDNTITQVDVRRVKMSNSLELDKSILELTKYISKDSNYLINEQVFECFYKGLRGKRTYSFSGDFKIARDKFKKGELDYLIPKDKTEWYYLIKSIWNNKKYNEIIELAKDNIRLDKIEKESIF